MAPHRNLSQPYHVLHRFLKPRHPPYTLCSRRERCMPSKLMNDHMFTTRTLCTAAQFLSVPLPSFCRSINLGGVARRYILRAIVASSKDDPNESGNGGGSQIYTDIHRPDRPISYRAYRSKPSLLLDDPSKELILGAHNILYFTKRF